MVRNKDENIPYQSQEINLNNNNHISELSNLIPTKANNHQF